MDADTAETWATVAVAAATTLGILIGGAWALWRYIIPSRFIPSWDVEVRSCTVRKARPGRYHYIVDLGFVNESDFACKADKAFGSVSIPGEELATPPECTYRQVDLQDPVSDPRSPIWLHIAAPLEVAANQSPPQTILVAWRILYRKRPWRYLGFFGWTRDTYLYEGTRLLPVDAESVALYTKISDEAPSR